MRVTIKTLQQTQFPVEIDADDTVMALKGKIEQMDESKRTPVANQKLIHSGKVLEDSQSLSASSVKEGDFIVLMAVKPRPATTSATAKATAETAASAAKAASTSSATGGNADDRLAESTLLTGEAYEEAVCRLVDMGFAREKAIDAMRASFNNPERAVEYLTAGSIPAEDSSVAQHSDTLQFLRNDPQFQQLRAIIRQNPSMLAPIIEQLGQSSPELLQLIEQNREEFYSLLMEDGAETAEGGEFSEEDYEDEGNPSVVIRLSAEDQSAVDRLEAMGFDRQKVIEAYLSCDKNEELAANYLLEHLDD